MYEGCQKQRMFVTCIYRGTRLFVEPSKAGTRGRQRETNVWPLIHYFGGV